MKKAFTILFIIVVLLSGTTIKYSTHYCQGVFIASRLSITGEDASCGMKQSTRESKDNQFSNLMCVNKIASYTFNDNYVYSPQVQDAGKHLQHIELPIIIIPKIITLTAISPELRQLPPGSPGPLKAESEVLCVFRI